MSEKIFTCPCLNVKIQCSEQSMKVWDGDGKIRNVLKDDILNILDKPIKHVKHDWLLRDVENSTDVKHCAACDSKVFAIQGNCLIVPEKFLRTKASLEALQKHDCFSECFQIIVDPSMTLMKKRNDSILDEADSLVPGSLEGVRLKMAQVVKQKITEKQQIIEEEHRKALERLRALQTQCDFQCNTLLKIIDYQENMEGSRRFLKTKSCSSVERSESIESKTSLRSVSKDPAFEDDVFEMHFNEQAIYGYGEDPEIEKAEEASELSPSDDEGVSTASQERTRRSSMDLSQYATSLPINVPHLDEHRLQGLRPGEHARGMREQSPAKPVCVDDIARSMRDLSDRMNDDHTKIFGDLPRPRLYTNHF